MEEGPVSTRPLAPFTYISYLRQFDAVQRLVDILKAQFAEAAAANIYDKVDGPAHQESPSLTAHILFNQLPYFVCEGVV